MGCTASKATSDGKAISSYSSYHLIINENCPHIRLDHSQGKKVLEMIGSVFNYSLGYVYVSQRGYYPNGLPSLPLLSDHLFHHYSFLFIHFL